MHGSSPITHEKKKNAVRQVFDPEARVGYRFRTLKASSSNGLVKLIHPISTHMNFTQARKLKRIATLEPLRQVRVAGST